MLVIVKVGVLSPLSQYVVTPQTQIQHENVTGLTTIDTNDFNPTWSPDGTMILYMSSGRNLHIMSQDGSGKKQLTRDVYVDDFAWSRDKEIIFATSTHGSPFDILVMDIHGDCRKLVDNASGVPGFCLDPNGDVLHGSRNSADLWDVWAVNISGDRRRVISDISTSCPGSQFTVFPGCSARTPDGKVLSGYMMAYGGHIYEYIYFVDANGNCGMLNATLDTRPETDRFFKWSSDGEKIAFISDRSGRSEIWIMDLDGGNKTQLTASGDDCGPIGWSAGGFDWSSGGRIAYSVHSRKSVYIPKWGTEWEEENEIRVMDADGCDNRVLLHLLDSSGKIDDLAWSPDGSEIAFVFQPDSGNRDIYVLDVPAMAADEMGEIKRPTETSPPTSEVYQTPDNLTDESLAIEIPDRLTGEERLIAQIALKNRTVQEMLRGQEIKIGSVSMVSGGETDEYGKESSYDLPGVQIYIGDKDWTSIIEIIPLVDLKERKVACILKNTFIKPTLPVALTENEKSNALKIALDDPQVKEKIAGRDYEIITVTDYENRMTCKRVGPTQVLIHVNETGVAYSITVNVTENRVTKVGEQIWSEGQKPGVGLALR